MDRCFMLGLLGLLGMAQGQPLLSGWPEAPTPVEVPPAALPTGCLNRSLSSPLWEIESFRYLSGQRTSIDFLLRNNMTDSTSHCSFQQEGVGLSTATNKTFTSEAANVSNTTFSYDTTTSSLTINQTWTCRGGGLTSPYVLIPTTSRSGVASADVTTSSELYSPGRVAHRWT
jgi:hypothetical protein